jgi:uncharacterized protein YjiK
VIRTGVFAAGLALLLVPSPQLRESRPLPERYDLDDPVDRHDLPGRLHEASGLAWGPDGMLYAHDDERSRVYRIDPRTGDADHGFDVGAPLVRDDFEGIAVAGERFFLVSSRGWLYEFRAVDEGETSPVRVSDTELGPECEVEGLTYEAQSRDLILACKSLRSGTPEIRIHRLPLDPDTPRPPVLRIPFGDLAPFGLKGGVHPSAVDVDPATGTLVLLAAREERMLEVDASGRILAVVKLPHRRHPQAEGIAFGTDGRLYVADEGQGGHAHLTVYARRGGEGAP